MNARFRFRYFISVVSIAVLGTFQSTQAAPDSFGPRGTVTFQSQPDQVQRCTTGRHRVWDGISKRRTTKTSRHCAGVESQGTAPRQKVRSSNPKEK